MATLTHRVASISKPSAPSSSNVVPPEANKTAQTMVDFFSAIEEEQQTIFNPATTRFVHLVLFDAAWIIF
jgi:hypothetical protein